MSTATRSAPNYAAHPMSTATPTPGPWHVDHPYGEPGTYVSAANTALVARVFPAAIAAEREANARLIAAAPSLLNGCNALLGLIDLVSGRDDMPAAIKEALRDNHRINEARAAIKMATVQSQG